MKINYFKKSIAAALAVFVMGGTLPAVQFSAPVMTAFAEEEDIEVIDGYFTYNVYSNFATVKKYNDPARYEYIEDYSEINPEIKSMINGVPVTEIEENAFSFCEINSLTIPSTIEKIDMNALGGVIHSFIVDENNEYYSSDDEGVLYANSYYYNKERHYGEKSVLFYYPDGKENTQYEIKDSVEYIYYHAFYKHTELKTVTIPDSVKVVDYGAFAGCRFNSIIMPKSVSYISKHAFFYCEKLSSIVILNPECKLEDWICSNEWYGSGQTTAPKYTGTIVGYSNSTAQEYAEKWGYNFFSLGKAPIDPVYSLGDLDGDGFIDSADASAVLVEYAAIQTGESPSVDKSIGDVNGDDLVDSSDASDILQYYSFIQTGGNSSLEDFLKTL